MSDDAVIRRTIWLTPYLSIYLAARYHSLKRSWPQAPVRSHACHVPCVWSACHMRLMCMSHYHGNTVIHTFMCHIILCKQNWTYISHMCVYIKQPPNNPHVYIARTCPTCGLWFGDKAYFRPWNHVADCWLWKLWSLLLAGGSVTALLIAFNKWSDGWNPFSAKEMASLNNAVLFSTVSVLNISKARFIPLSSPGTAMEDGPVEITTVNYS